MTSPWSDLDAATGAKNLYLSPAVLPALNQAFELYRESLQTLINDSLDDTTGYFGTLTNPLARLLESAFNSRGTVLTNYLKVQLSETTHFKDTAHDAVIAIGNADSP